MSEPFVGEIRMFGGNFAPRGWAFCDGQLLAVSQNDALFSLLGTIYGGDGETTFGLPDLRGRIPIHAGHGPGLSERRLGAKGGEEKVTLMVNQMPSHNHAWQVSNSTADNRSPADSPYANTQNPDVYQDSEDNLAAFNNDMVSSAGGSHSHTNMMPFLCINFIVALVGIYPSRH
ncbi:MAG: phage tail protein [Saprospiraceae bacterium]|nr:phage tail protein [Saprospiraceae bacterium]